jgi:SAM-dependent methyltransferase
MSETPSATPDQSIEHNAPAPRVILEIGAGRYSEFGSWRSVAERRPFAPHQRYIGIDIGEQGAAVPDDEDHIIEFDTLMRQHWREVIEHRPDEQISFLQANGADIPLKENTVNSIIFSNVFGSGAHIRFLPFFLQEAMRVLKDDGVIIIHDEISPYHVSWQSMLSEITSAGLVADTQEVDRFRRSERPEAYQEITRSHGLAYSPLSHDGVIWLLGKLEQRTATEPQLAAESELMLSQPDSKRRALDKLRGFIMRHI